MIYVANNAAKQWILEELANQQPDRILDLACGNGKVWQRFLQQHPALRVLGVDTDTRAIEQGKKMYGESQNIELRVHDAQAPVQEGSFDVVVALSAIEHVVDRPAFLRTVWTALKSGGVAYLNYDAGHFRSHNLKEYLMIPISQALARLGFEGPYMKEVDDALFSSQANQIGFEMIELRKHNIFFLKHFMRSAEDGALEDWFDFEKRMNRHFSSAALDRLMWSSTLVIRKPKTADSSV